MIKISQISNQNFKIPDDNDEEEDTTKQGYENLNSNCNDSGVVGDIGSDVEGENQQKKFGGVGMKLDDQEGCNSDDEFVDYHREIDESD